MPVTTNTRKLAALLGASGAGIGTDGLLQAAAVDANIATQAELDAAEFDDNTIQTNLALLAFKTAVNGSLAKYNLQDQVIDEYTDATGIDATPSTNHTLLAGAYSGGDLPPTVTHGADSTGTSGDYTWYKWTDTAATGSYETDTTQDHEWLVVAGGGAGGNGHSASGMGGGGGGAGGYRTGASLTGVKATQAVSQNEGSSPSSPR